MTGEINNITMNHLNNKNVSINLPRRFGINSNNSELNDNKDDERK
ncbi:24616_t:CDS:2 [Entrophospora sp. SA101]|nr:24616_t:CDS:2 [Entrophospora sp. SA101]